MALVEAGLPVNHPDESGVTLLHYLCDWDNGGDIAKKVELVGFLLDHGADWTTRAFIPRDTVLHRLARAGLLPGSFDDVICRIVREWPGSPDISAVNDHGYTVLHLYSERTILSCSAGKDMVRLLVQAGCDLNVRNNWGYAVAHGNPSPLDSIKAVDFFADLGMDLNLPDSMGRPPLHYVVCNKPVYVRRHEQEAIVRYLLEKGVAPHPGCQSCE
ncbi:ankyrin repeat-containing domain protein [Aspergillus keveii]|uniref:Ankyrin repeat-containing domain protein n=1 Tax=Aspergillus keveii TaxID=714993 RepID=A0ABR4FS20_9EURO